ncbi:uncharacterized protein LOC135432640 [Drosophila montana]|uniref:uncharacterized protein LOC135432640 n=1 Tax=Drosophila montana TaxID=40370 RepID=UPI00313D358E
MGQRRNAESVVTNFVIFLLILQNCGQARTQPEIGPELPQRRDGLAKFEFSAPQQQQQQLPVKGSAGGRNGCVGPADPLYVFNFAKIYETLYAQLMQQPPTGGEQRGRGLRQPQAQLLWATQSEGIAATTAEPFHVLQQLELDLEEKLKHTTTMKPFSVLEHLALEQEQQLQQHKGPNVSFNIVQQLQMEQDRHVQGTTTVQPFDVFEQLDQDLQEQENAFEILQPAAEPLEQHKSAKLPAESSRAKDSQKRKRKRIRRRRKRIRRRRKRKRRRGKKKRKKKRKKKDKKKKKKKRRKPTAHQPVLGQQAQLIFANPTKQPYHAHHSHYSSYPHKPMAQTTILQLVTTKRPVTSTKAPFSKIKYLLRHNSLFKKKKKEWVNHVGHVLYPFIKFVAFFTVLNPFTLGVFLFTLVSPVVFGFLGFVALSVLVKPFLHLVFGVKRNVDYIDRKHYLANKRAEQLKLNLRPVTIHKHFYQQKPLHSTPPRHHPPLVDWRRHATQPDQRRHNPLLPTEQTALSQEDLYYD